MLVNLKSNRCAPHAWSVHSVAEITMGGPMILFLAVVAHQAAEIFSENASNSGRLLSCRNERMELTPYDRFLSGACAGCYQYLPSWAFHNAGSRFKYIPRYGVLKDHRTNLTYEADPNNASIALLESFSSESFTAKWKSCCQAAWQCCQTMLQDPPSIIDGPYCPRTWDGWQCWPDTPADSIAKAPCPLYIYFRSDPPACTKYAEKICSPNGTWFLNEQNREWTNYSNCGKKDEHRNFLYFHIATYAVTIAFLIPALVIFFSYKQLQVHRITMHKNLFVSLLLNATMVIIFKSVVMFDELDNSETYKSLMEQNGSGCKFLFTLTKYFRMTNYMWMFCEGFYLHKLIAAAFAEQKNLLMFYLIGWVFPTVPVGIYAILRQTLANEKCWTFPVEMYEWIVNTPNLLSLLVNLAFLCNIIRVLVTKLRATHANEPSQYRKAVRATLVLVPLFGLHFCLVIYRPQSGECKAMEAYTYFNHAMDGLQGFLVSLIFCYLNGEVLYLLRRTYQRFRLHHDFRGRGQTSSICLNRMSTTQVSSVGESQVGNSFRGRKPPSKTANHKGQIALEQDGNSDSGPEHEDGT